MSSALDAVHFPERLSAAEKRALSLPEEPNAVTAKDPPSMLTGWTVAHDPKTGQACFFHAATNTATKDLRRFILTETDGVFLSPRPKEQTPNDGELAASSDCGSAPDLRSELEVARNLNEVYEMELTHLRHALFAGLAERDGPEKWIPQLPNDKRLLEERIRTLERLNARLYARIVTDRAEKIAVTVTGEQPKEAELDDWILQRPMLAQASTQLRAAAPKSFLLSESEMKREKGKYGEGDIATKREILSRIPQYLPRSFATTNLVTSTAPLHVDRVGVTPRLGETSTVVRHIAPRNAIVFDHEYPPLSPLAKRLFLAQGPGP